MISLKPGGRGWGYHMINIAPGAHHFLFYLLYTEQIKMPLYPTNVLRCQHIKVNGTQCASPSIRESTYCYYHVRYHWNALDAVENHSEWRQSCPTLEDANSIQVSLAQVMERLVMQEIDHKTAALMLYALQTASMNLKRTTLEPELPTQVVIDRQSVARRPLGASAWSRVEGREYDDLTAESDGTDESRIGESMEKYLPEAAADGQLS